jgi:hypothetical protein
LRLDFDIFSMAPISMGAPVSACLARRTSPSSSIAGGLCCDHGQTPPVKGHLRGLLRDGLIRLPLRQAPPPISACRPMVAERPPPSPTENAQLFRDLGTIPTDLPTIVSPISSPAPLLRPPKRGLVAARGTIGSAMGADAATSPAVPVLGGAISTCEEGLLRNSCAQARQGAL